MSVNPRVNEGKLNHRDIDASSPTYHEIMRYLEEEIGLLRKDNDNVDLTDAQTSALRGRIKENRTLLSKLKPPKQVSTVKMRQ